MSAVSCFLRVRGGRCREGTGRNPVPKNGRWGDREMGGRHGEWLASFQGGGRKTKDHRGQAAKRGGLHSKFYVPDTRSFAFFPYERKQEIRMIFPLRDRVFLFGKLGAPAALFFLPLCGVCCACGAVLGPWSKSPWSDRCAAVRAPSAQSLVRGPWSIMRGACAPDHERIPWQPM